MNLNSRYLIDANVFIQAKNFHYRFGFCQGFWQWLTDAHHAEFVFSIDKVRQEINKGNEHDPVRLWADALPNGFFIADTNDITVMKVYGEVMQWSTSNKHYSPQAKDDFASFHKADAFLIAVAKTHNFTIVTQEVSKQYAKGNIKIPDVAKELNIKNITIYDLLSRHATGNFALSL
jgi:hypothetical protein